MYFFMQESLTPTIEANQAEPIEPGQPGAAEVQRYLEQLEEQQRAEAAAQAALAERLAQEALEAAQAAAQSQEEYTVEIPEGGSAEDLEVQDGDLNGLGREEVLQKYERVADPEVELLQIKIVNGEAHAYLGEEDIIEIMGREKFAANGQEHDPAAQQAAIDKQNYITAKVIENGHVVVEYEYERENYFRKYVLIDGKLDYSTWKEKPQENIQPEQEAEPTPPPAVEGLQTATENEDGFGAGEEEEEISSGQNEEYATAESEEDAHIRERIEELEQLNAEENSNEITDALYLLDQDVPEGMQVTDFKPAAGAKIENNTALLFTNAEGQFDFQFETGSTLAETYGAEAIQRAIEDAEILEDGTRRAVLHSETDGANSIIILNIAESGRTLYKEHLEKSVAEDADSEELEFGEPQAAMQMAMESSSAIIESGYSADQPKLEHEQLELHSQNSEAGLSTTLAEQLDLSAVNDFFSKNTGISLELPPKNLNVENHGAAKPDRSAESTEQFAATPSLQTEPKSEQQPEFEQPAFEQQQPEPQQFESEEQFQARQQFEFRPQPAAERYSAPSRDGAKLVSVREIFRAQNEIPAEINYDTETGISLAEPSYGKTEAKIVTSKTAEFPAKPTMAATEKKLADEPKIRAAEQKDIRYSSKTEAQTVRTQAPKPETLKPISKISKEQPAQNEQRVEQPTPKFQPEAAKIEAAKINLRPEIAFIRQFRAEKPLDERAQIAKQNGSAENKAGSREQQYRMLQALRTFRLNRNEIRRPAPKAAAQIQEDQTNNKTVPLSGRKPSQAKQLRLAA